MLFSPYHGLLSALMNLAEQLRAGCCCEEIIRAAITDFCGLQMENSTGKGVFLAVLSLMHLFFMLFLN